jgi:hypothetical protein
MRNAGPIAGQILLLIAFPFPALAQAQDTADSGKVTEVAVYTDHPRLFLSPQRLRLVRRETQRQTLRWEQFQALMGAKTAWSEPAFAAALYYEAGGDKDAGRRAVAWALDPKNTDLRQLAIVFDWCQELLTPAENRTLAARLQKAITGVPAPKNLENARDLVLAAIAVADQAPAQSKAELSAVLQKYWPAAVVTPLGEGKLPIARSDSLALLEILHATRDNLNVDLRRSFPAWFKPLALEWLLSYYPTPWPAAENEFHIAASSDPVKNGTPDLKTAALSRAAELALVAFDTNAPEIQVLQGWLMNDRFLMRGPFGIAYEFLWANPYQPGLSYYHVPLVFRDDTLGLLFMRSSWDDDAKWLGYFTGPMQLEHQLQLFEGGRITVLNPELTRGPLNLEEGIVFFGKAVSRFTVPASTDPEHATEDVFIVGLKPHLVYSIETDDEELNEAEADIGGTLFFPATRSGVTIRLSPAPQAAGPAAGR